MAKDPIVRKTTKAKALEGNKEKPKVAPNPSEQPKPGPVIIAEVKEEPKNDGDIVQGHTGSAIAVKHN